MPVSFFYHRIRMGFFNVVFSIMRKIICLVFIFLGFHTKAQYNVKFVLNENTAIVHDSIFITGTFNHWDSTSNSKYLMRPVGNRQYAITLNLPAGETKYKFHRGSWFTVEKELDGGEVFDRVIRINSDSAFSTTVDCWRDQLLVDKKLRLQRETTDTGRVKLLDALARNYGFFSEFFNIDSAQHYARETLKLYQQISASDETQQWEDLGSSREVLANLFSSLGNYPRALELRFENLRIAETRNDPFHLADAYRSISNTYISIKDYRNALKYAKLGYSVLKLVPPGTETYGHMKWLSDYQLATCFYGLNELDSALNYVSQPVNGNILNTTVGMAFKCFLLGDIYSSKNQPDSAFNNYRRAIDYNSNFGSAVVYGSSLLGISKLFRSTGRVDSAIAYARAAMSAYENNLSNLQSWGENKDAYVTEVVSALSEMYREKNQPDSAYKYLRLATVLKDSLYNNEKLRQFQILGFNEAARVQQLEQQERITAERYRNRIKMYGLIGGLIAFLIIAFVLYRNNRQKQQSNQKLTEQKDKLEETLQELKSTQAQLIQSEKMASLGELTAGIAHEIQNPLNFVNNFSEVNKEMVDELQTELKLGNIREALAISGDIRDNSEKINQHGRRADSIVKGMLQHTRTSTGQKELTDINTLCDEYFRLAYHGLRAKDKSFNATLKAEFESNLRPVSIVSQDIGRVILNLLNNAFYACTERSRSAVNEKSKQHIPDYEPTVTLSTRNIGKAVEINVKDNGNGIPPDLSDKIFQPFFTTKPTGHGTGLGLSLSYDIIKAHGGNLTVSSSPGRETVFTIILPANTNGYENFGS